MPKDKKIAPKVANDVKLINAGKILENNKTVGQCRAPFGELPNGVIIIHAVVQPSVAKVKTEKKIDEAPKKKYVRVLYCNTSSLDESFNPAKFLNYQCYGLL